jgi:RIO-like serine/threonine protein kinase
MAKGHAKAIQAIIVRLEEQGFTVELAKNGHYSVTCPEKIILPPGARRRIQIPQTPSIERTVLNTITRLKRIGYVHER